MSIDWLHAIITALLVWGVYMGAEGSGALDGRSRGTRFMIMLPVYLVVILLFNVIWRLVV